MNKNTEITTANLPLLTVNIAGSVEQSNLPEYKSSALALIESISTDLVSDSDFANAEKMILFCGGAEKELERTRVKALHKTEDIEHLFKMIDHLKL